MAWQKSWLPPADLRYGGGGYHQDVAALCIVIESCLDVIQVWKLEKASEVYKLSKPNSEL